MLFLAKSFAFGKLCDLFIGGSRGWTRGSGDPYLKITSCYKYTFPQKNAGTDPLEKQLDLRGLYNLSGSFQFSGPRKYSIAHVFWQKKTNISTGL